MSIMVELIIIRQECQLLATLCKHCCYQVGKGKREGDAVITVHSPPGAVVDVCRPRCPLRTDVKTGLSSHNIIIHYITKNDVKCRMGLGTLLRNVDTFTIVKQ
jgi:hypothetical protein